jgi:hypothetical protein
MKGFKDSTKVKYMCGGPVKKAGGGGVFNERGKRATNAEIAAEGRRMEGRKPPVEGISTRPTDSSGRRMTNAELGMTPGGVNPAKKAPAKSMNSVAELGALAAKKKKAVPAHSDRPMIRLPIPRSKGGLMAMPKGK